MELYTLDVGQGAFALLVGDEEAIIIDTYIRRANDTEEEDLEVIREALPGLLEGKNLIGIIQTGFDADHFNAAGLYMIMNEARPRWIMYPTYYKDTENAKQCFNIIDEYDKENKNFQRISIGLTKVEERWIESASDEWDFEFFSPYLYGNETSNNKSLVVKIHPKKSGVKKYSILVTGDTEGERWSEIVKYFGKAIDADILMAPHHGSRNGIIQDAYDLIDPYHVLISAGANNKYGHPHPEALRIYHSNGALVLRTDKHGTLLTYSNSYDYYTETDIDIFAD